LSDENVFIQVFKIVWNLGNLGQNLGKILENLQQENLETGQIFSSEAEHNFEILGIWEILEILESWTKSGNISALTEALADELEILKNQTES
jgi:flagellar biosynthesis/type III secretory pathway chaperone